MLPVV